MGKTNYLNQKTTSLINKDGSSIDKDNPLYIHSVSEIDTGNSSTTTLLADAIFTGVAKDIRDESVIQVAVFSNVASATDGFMIQWSTDGTNFDGDDVYTIPAGTQKTYSFQPVSQYYRIKYTNGGTDQTVFRMQSILKSTYIKPSSHRIQDAIIDDDDAELVKAVLTAKSDGDGFTNMTATASNNLKVANVEDGLSIAKGDVANTTFIHKFGNAPDFDAGDGVVTIWDGADDGDINQMQYVYSSTDDIDSISSGNAGDTQDIQILGLDTNFDEVIQTVTLNGQNRVALSTNLIRVNRMVNVNSTDNIGRIYCYVNGDITNGVPDDSTTIRAVIQPGNNQTLMALFTIPAGKTGYMRDWFASIAGANKSSNYILDLRARPTGGVFQLKHRSSLSDNGTSHTQHKYEEPEIFLEKTDIEMRVNAASIGTTAASFSGGFDIVLVNN